MPAVQAGSGERRPLARSWERRGERTLGPGLTSHSSHPAGAGEREELVTTVTTVSAATFPSVTRRPGSTPGHRDTLGVEAGGDDQSDEGGMTGVMSE